MRMNPSLTGNCTCIRSHNGVQDLVMIPLSVQSLCPCLGHEDRWDRLTPSHTCRPSTITIVLHDVTLVSTLSPDTLTRLSQPDTRNLLSYVKENGRSYQCWCVPEQTPDELCGVLRWVQPIANCLNTDICSLPEIIRRVLAVDLRLRHAMFRIY